MTLCMTPGQVKLSTRARPCMAGCFLWGCQCKANVITDIKLIMRNVLRSTGSSMAFHPRLQQQKAAVKQNESQLKTSALSKTHKLVNNSSPLRITCTVSTLQREEKWTMEKSVSERCYLGPVKTYTVIVYGKHLICVLVCKKPQTCFWLPVTQTLSLLSLSDCAEGRLSCVRYSECYESHNSLNP